ncbi:MAG: hypothetical protein C4538_09950 [Nitrospiraceae bacterium]|nr:MAG: hypothetical protein C4538_09950 [Nitrospiraceae bacterium]
MTNNEIGKYMNSRNSHNLSITGFSFREDVQTEVTVSQKAEIKLSPQVPILMPCSFLRDYDFIPDLFKKGKARRLYTIKTEIGAKQKTYLTFLKPAGFYRLNDIERRKEKYFKSIKSMSPC